MSHKYSRLKQFLTGLWKMFFRKKPLTSANASTNHLVASTNEFPSTTLPSMDPLPWGENWKLDEEFFGNMKAWNTQHPQSTLMKLMEKVNDTVVQHKMVLDFVPNAPFPAGSLVKGLAHLLELGVKVARAKHEVSAFTMEVINWVSTVEASLGNPESKGVFTAQNNLEQIRDLINEICKWAWCRLKDQRWTALVNGLAIAEEIRIFKEKLTEARQLLLNLQMITVVVGVDEILDQIRVIKELQESQLREVIVRLENAKAAEERERFLERTLLKVALSNTAYDDQGKPPCDEDTRVEILADIKRWVDDVSAESQNFFWLTGDPGCGKSAVTASLARHCKDAGTLWAQYFINRNNEATTNPRAYFPSIARQMGDHTTSDDTIMNTIYEIIERKPSDLDQITINQALGLFAETVQAACDQNRSKPVVIVIDGLDETRRDKLEDTAKIFSELFKALKRPNAKVFISSRTDDEITRPFYRVLQSDKRHVKHVHLDTSDPSSVGDVSRYLSRNVKELVEKWDINWGTWPGEERFNNLCIRAGGLFIWAVTVVKFFQEQFDQSRDERLNELLDIFNEEGMGDVNRLYGKILEITYRVKTNTKAQDEWEYEKFQWIVGFIVAMKEPLPIGDIAAILDLKRMPSSNPVNVMHFVTKLRTVLVAGTGTISGETIPRVHKSFVEYITSERADAKFRIGVRVVESQIATKCLRLLARERRGLSPTGSVRYAIQSWSGHLQGGGSSESGVGVVGDKGEGFWKMLSTTAGLRKGFLSVSGDYRTHMYDPTMGLPPPVEYSHSSPINERCSAIAVSHDGRLIASGEPGHIQIRDSRSYQRIQEIQSHDVDSLCFSPDSRWLVFSSTTVSDHDLRMWNWETGETVDFSDEESFWSAMSVCTDGQRIVSGSEDGAIHIWS